MDYGFPAYAAFLGPCVAGGVGALLIWRRVFAGADACGNELILQLTHIMKTTLDLDDALLMEAKAAAARRRTTLKAIVEHALRRELAPPTERTNPDPKKFEVGPLGFLVLKRKPGATITSRQIRAVQEGLDEEDLRRAIHPRRA